MARNAMKKRSRERENARDRKERLLRRITLDGVQSVPVVKDAKSAAYQRNWYAKNREKAKAAARERMRAYRQRNRERLTKQRQLHQGMRRKIYLASKRLAGWRWCNWEHQVNEEYTPFQTVRGWYEQWFASLDEPDLYPWD